MSATTTTPDTTIGAVLAKLDAIQESMSTGFADLHSRVDAVSDRVDGAVRVAQHAQGDATEAKRMASEIEKSQSDTVKAMQAHAAQVAASAGDIVKANDAQTPILQSTLDIAMWLKKSAPALMGGASVLGAVLWEILRPIVSGFLHH
jgi:hypothetical protein